MGEHRCGRAFAYKEFEDGAATLALGSDAPTAPHAPFPNLYTATTRRSAREPQYLEVVNYHFTLSLASAVSAATAGSAYSCFADTWAGSLEKGKKADFVVVDPSKKLGSREGKSLTLRAHPPFDVDVLYSDLSFNYKEYSRE